MNFRSDHVAGAAFVAFGVLIIALSGDLPTGQLSMPGSGFMPKIVKVKIFYAQLATCAPKSRTDRSAIIRKDAIPAARYLCLLIQ